MVVMTNYESFENFELSFYTLKENINELLEELEVREMTKNAFERDIQRLEKNAEDMELDIGEVIAQLESNEEEREFEEFDIEESNYGAENEAIEGLQSVKSALNSLLNVDRDKAEDLVENYQTLISEVYRNLNEVFDYHGDEEVKRILVNNTGSIADARDGIKEAWDNAKINMKIAFDDELDFEGNELGKRVSVINNELVYNEKHSVKAIQLVPPLKTGLENLVEVLTKNELYSEEIEEYFAVVNERASELLKWFSSWR